jgi:hypothetical protein
MEDGKNTLADHEHCHLFNHYYLVTPSNTHHPPLALSHTCWIRTSNKEQGNNMHLLIHQKHNNISHLINHPIQ